MQAGHCPHPGGHTHCNCNTRALHTYRQMSSYAHGKSDMAEGAPRLGGEVTGFSHPVSVYSLPSSVCPLPPRGQRQRKGNVLNKCDHHARCCSSRCAQREADILERRLGSPANCPMGWSLALGGAPTGSLLSENTHASITALGPHGGYHFPAVDDGVIALDAAQQAVPVIAAGEGRPQA